MEISVTLVIIVVTTLVSFTALGNEKLMDGLIFYPPAINEHKQWYRFFSNGLLHADLPHLIFNMFALYLFGLGQTVQTEEGSFHTGVEYSFIYIFGEIGRWLYLLMYVLALAACLLPTYSKHKHNYQYRSLGASGAVSAVIFANILFDPLSGMGLMFIPVYVAGFVFGILYLVISSWMEKSGHGNINHSAHIFGALFGIIFLILTSGLFSDYHVLPEFWNQIKNMNPKDIIQFGR